VDEPYLRRTGKVLYLFLTLNCGSDFRILLSINQARETIAFRKSRPCP
jgi:hypothetical protein